MEGSIPFIPVQFSKKYWWFGGRITAFWHPTMRLALVLTCLVCLKFGGPFKLFSHTQWPRDITLMNKKHWGLCVTINNKSLHTTNVSGACPLGMRKYSNYPWGLCNHTYNIYIYKSLSLMFLGYVHLGYIWKYSNYQSFCKRGSWYFGFNSHRFRLILETMGWSGHWIIPELEICW